MLVADSHVVNCIQPHPTAFGRLPGGGRLQMSFIAHVVCTPLLLDPLPPSVLASSGIDYNVKLWEPVSQDLCSLDHLDEV